MNGAFPHFERPGQTQCIIASVTGLAGGFANLFHLMSQVMGFISGVGGAVITVITIWGFIKRWAEKRALRTLIASQTMPPPQSAAPIVTTTIVQPPPPGS